MSSSPATDQRVSVIVPVKRLGAAKTRTHLPAPEREELALELMARTVTAALSATFVARVIVVAGDLTVETAAHQLGAITMAEPPGVGLNGALAAGREFARSQFGADIAIVVGDLAHLTADDLDAVIAEYIRTGEPMLVPDHLGTGTAMLIHGHASSPPLLFGAGSAARHQASGYRRFTDAPDSARRDVDDPRDVALLSRPSR